MSRKDAVAAELARLGATPAIDAEALAATVAARATDLPGVLGRHQQPARQLIRQLLAGGRWEAVPYDDERERGYRFRAVGDYRALGIPELDAFTVRDSGTRNSRPSATAIDRASAIQGT